MHEVFCIETEQKYNLKPHTPVKVTTIFLGEFYIGDIRAWRSWKTYIMNFSSEHMVFIVELASIKFKMECH